MFKRKIERFIIKRVLIILFILAILNMIFLKERLIVLLGLIIGAAISILRFSCMASFFSNLFMSSQKTAESNKGIKFIFVYILNQALAIFFLAVSLKFNQWFFWGALSGILLVPAVLFINSLTESLGISHNNFE